MTTIITAILLVGFMLIATAHLTRVNKAAVAIFACTVGWVLYISYGTDFVMAHHADEYLAFLQGTEHTSLKVKEFIASYILLKYIGRACEIVLFLMATRTIVELLDQNECFDLIHRRLATRHSRRLLWSLSLVTLLISANLDNFTTTVMMLLVMRRLVATRPQRMIYGAAIVVAANMGGALSVIGSPTGLTLWNSSLVTASRYFLAVAPATLTTWAVTTWLIGRQLPEHVEADMQRTIYRGDDARLPVWQRMLMLVLGLGGLWFVPTFRNITQLSPFLGALCVLGVIWVVNEIFNRQLLTISGVSERRVPQSLFDGSNQVGYYVLGMLLLMGVVLETGALSELWTWIGSWGIDSRYVAFTSGLVSIVLDNFATSASYISLNPSVELNDSYWTTIGYMVHAGGNVLLIGSMAGIALLRAEKVHSSWYFQHAGWQSLVGLVCGTIVMALTNI